MSPFDPSSLPFNDNQRLIFNTIMEAFKRDQIAGDIAPAHFGNNLFFFDGPGGTGRTYLFNALLHAIRRTDSVVLSVAVSGTADLLLKGGRTAHLKFKIPLDCSTTSICNMRPSSPAAHLVATSAVII